MTDVAPPTNTELSGTSYRRPSMSRFPSERNDPKDWQLPSTPKAIIIHALKGGARAFVLAYGVRAGVNLCLGILRVIRGRSALSRVFVTAFKGTDSLRFGAMFGIFSLLWKLVNNSLRYGRGVDDRLNGFIAGSIASLALLAEKPERRLDIAQQLFVRALQATYNAGKSRHIIDFKHGDALLFALASAQVLYAYIMHPHTLPPDFYNFMVHTARVPREVLELNCVNIRGMPLDVNYALNVVNKYHPTVHAIKTISNLPLYPDAIPCELLHPPFDSCNYTFIERFYRVFRNMLPVYTSLHLVPMLLLRTKHFLKAPIKLLTRTGIASLKSGGFFATFISLYQYQICLHRNLMTAGWVTSNPKLLYYVAGMICAGVSIFIEEKKRRSELALYVLPKAMQSLYEVMYQRKLMFKMKHFEIILCSMAMGVIMVCCEIIFTGVAIAADDATSIVHLFIAALVTIPHIFSALMTKYLHHASCAQAFYQHEPEVLSSLVRKIMYQFFQKN